MSKRILVPVGGFTKGEKAFEFVLEEYPESTMMVLGVLTPPNLITYSDGEFGYFDVEAYNRTETDRRRKLEEVLATLSERAEDRGIEIETVIVAGGPVDSVLEAAEERSVDLIVMGGRDRSGIGRVLFGDVAETVSRRATVPVTIVS